MISRMFYFLYAPDFLVLLCCVALQHPTNTEVMRICSEPNQPIGCAAASVNWGLASAALAGSDPLLGRYRRRAGRGFCQELYAQRRSPHIRRTEKNAELSLEPDSKRQ